MVILYFVKWNQVAGQHHLESLSLLCVMNQLSGEWDTKEIEKKKTKLTTTTTTNWKEK